MPEKSIPQASPAQYQELHASHVGDRALRRRRHHHGIGRTIQHAILKLIGRIHQA